MRLIGMILALGALCWVLYQAAGGGEAETAIPQGYQDSMKKAENLEDTIQATVQDRLQGTDGE